MVKWQVVKWLCYGAVMMGMTTGEAVFADTLEGTFTFTKRAPKVALVYFPEDESLPVDTSTLVDQKNEQFTKRLLVTRKGVKATFQNSDAVNHNIFAHDEKAGVKFDIGLMAPGGSVQQEITWEEQVVRCGCKIHPKMRLWIASISSRYYQTIEFEKKAKTASFTIENIPETLSKIKVWMPKYDPAEVALKAGETREISLVRKKKPRGVLQLTRK
ncbi:hypothetical protein C2W62_26060 [Candidatus Entotheonella serta]|nr:hypothetical protein C2W62_26060 [Candidatus Entotheonella serta]